MTRFYGTNLTNEHSCIFWQLSSAGVRCLKLVDRLSGLFMECTPSCQRKIRKAYKNDQNFLERLLPYRILSFLSFNLNQ